MMSDGVLLSWMALAGLGAFHGINPGMGWLFAVALGMQEHSGRAVWRALLPLGIGHTAASAMVLLLAALTGLLVPLNVVQVLAGGLLVSLGGYRLVRHRHPRWAAMRVGSLGLMTWSFLMASAHGAGLMVLPIVLHTAQVEGIAGHLPADLMRVGPGAALAASAIHGAAYLAVTALTAWLVFQKLGLGLLRQAWINLDLVWGAALVLTGVLTIAI